MLFVRVFVSFFTVFLGIEPYNLYYVNIFIFFIFIREKKKEERFVVTQLFSNFSRFTLKVINAIQTFTLISWNEK